jgi:FkbM family methyltransferase
MSLPNNSTILNSLRNQLNQLLAPSGLALTRVPRRGWLWGKPVVKVPVGSYQIEIPTTNPLSSHYLIEPHCISQLGRLAKIIRRKFPALRAIDVGANVGDTACIIKSAEDIPLICIEGDRFSFAFLQKNTAQFSHTSAYNLFLGEKTGLIQADLEKSGWNTTIKPGASPAAREVQLTSIDDFIGRQEAREAMKLLKVDTEGFDCPIIRGGREFIRQVSPVIVFEYNRENMDALGEKGLDTLAMLEQLGYSRIFLHDPVGRYLLSTTLDQRTLLQDLHEYADGRRGNICYYDVTLFHQSDNDLAEQYAQCEQAVRNASENARLTVH